MPERLNECPTAETDAKAMELQARLQEVERKTLAPDGGTGTTYAIGGPSLGDQVADGVSEHEFAVPLHTEVCFEFLFR